MDKTIKLSNYKIGLVGTPKEQVILDVKEVCRYKHINFYGNVYEVLYATENNQLYVYRGTRPKAITSGGINITATIGHSTKNGHPITLIKHIKINKQY